MPSMFWGNLVCYPSQDKLIVQLPTTFGTSLCNTTTCNHACHQDWWASDIDNNTLLWPLPYKVRPHPTQLWLQTCANEKHGLDWMIYSNTHYSWIGYLPFQVHAIDIRFPWSYIIEHASHQTSFWLRKQWKLTCGVHTFTGSINHKNVLLTFLHFLLVSYHSFGLHAMQA